LVIRGCVRRILLSHESDPWGYRKGIRRKTKLVRTASEVRVRSLVKTQGLETHESKSDTPEVYKMVLNHLAIENQEAGL